MILWIILGVVALIVTICAFAWYRVVDPSEAHLVVTPSKKFVVSADDNVATEQKRTYFAIPNWLPFFGRAIRIMDVTIKELVINQETYEKNQARYNVKSSTKYRVVDVQTSAETFISNSDLQEQLKEVIRAGVRAVTVKYDVIDARAMKQQMDNEIRAEIMDDLKKWGLDLINFQLVDFQDTESSHIISDISKRREIEIQSTTREQNAEKIKQAKMKEAEADEKAKEREIMRDQVVGEKEENKRQKIAEQQKIAEEKRYEVIKVQTIKQAEITKEKILIEANQKKEQEMILKDQKKLEGEGDRLRAEERAKGDAAPIREKGFAEALAKDKLQEALNKFGESAIMALVAEKIVAKEERVGVQTALALRQADVKIFAGGGKAGEEGFELGKMIQSMGVADSTTSSAVLNKIARPNDLGLTALGLDALNKEAEKKKKSFNTKK